MKRLILFITVVALILAGLAVIYGPASAQLINVFAKVEKNPITRLETQTLYFYPLDPVSANAVILADLNNVPVYHMQQIDMIWYDLGTYQLNVNVIDNGNSGFASTSFELIATPQSIKGTLARFCQQGYIVSASDCRANQQKMDVVIAQVAKGNHTAARALLRTIAADLDRSRGIPIQRVRDILKQDINYVIATLK